MSNMTKIFALALAATTVIAGAAQAGGFSRGNADTDILYEEGNFTMRAGVLYAAPQVKYDTINGAPSTDGVHSNSYLLPSAAIKLDIVDNLSCAGTVSQPFGASASYGPQSIAATHAAGGNGVVSEGFTSTELGLTCGAKFDAGPGRAWLIGGIYLQNFDYAQTVTINPLAPGIGGSNATLSFNDEYRLGYRIGAAYEIPEIALRGQVLYRSAVTHSPDTSQGSFTGLFGTLPAFGSGTLPQSVEVKLQSGVAPGWLVFGSVKWTDWSVLQTLDYTILGPAPLGGTRELEYAWRDGWTVSAGVGHKFNDMVSAQAALTWDRGVSTTEDAFGDTWGLSGGVALSNEAGNASLSLGGGITYITGGSVAAQAVPGAVGTIEPGASFAYTTKGSFAYAIGANFKVNF